ncbi:unnamed protein product [Amaranthus hypochondriacus]
MSLLKSFHFNGKSTLYTLQNLGKNIAGRHNLARLVCSALFHSFVEHRSGFDQNGSTFRCNDRTYLWLLKGWINLGSWSLLDCRKLHGLMFKAGIIQDIELYYRLFGFYKSNGCFWDAHKLFDEMLERDISLVLLLRMLSENVYQDEFTFANLFRESGGEKTDFWCTDQLHAKVIVNGFDRSRFVCNPLIDLYSKGGMRKYAKCIFKNIGERDNVSWVAMLFRLSQNGFREQAIRLFCDEIHALSSVSNSYGKTEPFKFGEELHGFLYKWGFAFDDFVCKTLVNFYSRWGQFISAVKVFETMMHRDEVIYNSLITGLVQIGRSFNALCLLQMMQYDLLEPDCVTVAGLISGCSAIGAIEKGHQLHAHALKAGFFSDMLIQESLLDLYVKRSDLETSYKYFLTTQIENLVLWNVMFLRIQMKGLEPNQYAIPVTRTSEGALNLGKQFHTQVITTGFQFNEYVSCVLIDMYAKHGNLNAAEKIFLGVSENSVAYTAMITGYRQLEMYGYALKLFKVMLGRGIQADNIGLSSVISSCAGIRAYYQGRQIHAQFYVLGYCGDDAIQNALVGLYARCGRPQDAYRAYDRLEGKNNNALVTGFAKVREEMGPFGDPCLYQDDYLCQAPA